MTHRFRFGLLGENVRSATALMETARRAESAGFATFLLRDHFIEEPFGHQLAPLTALATVAAATKRLRVGSLVLCNDYRHPVFLARRSRRSTCCPAGGSSSASVPASRDRNTRPPDSRLIHPACVSTVSRRRSRSSRGCSALRRSRSRPLLYGLEAGRVSQAGAAAAPAHPGRRGGPADARDRRPRGRHHRDPDSVLAETIAEKIGWVRQQAGARFDRIELSIVSSIIVAADRREVAERLVRERGWQGLSVERMFEMPSIFIGSVGQIVDEMQKRRERYGISYYVVSDRSLQTAAAIVARFAGG